MCYYLYGAVNKGVDRSDWEEVTSGKNYCFNIGTKHDVKMSVQDVALDYRITSGMCDCETALGLGEKDHEEIAELASLLEEMRLIRDVECVYLCKTWQGKRNKKEETYHIEDIDLPAFLADMEENCLYRIDLFSR